jgi:tRNA threonylcarbamoyladenosine biosynthesis protein TsaB
MKLLALDTSTDACSCALYINGEIQERFTIVPRQHSALILPMIDELLAIAALKVQQLDALAFGCGPGSFMGLRIASGIAQGIAFAAQLPVIPVSSLATLAQAAFLEQGVEKILACLDARMNEVYYGLYRLDKEKGIVYVEGDECVGAPQQISLPADGGWYGVGSGWISYAEQLLTHCGQVIHAYQGEKYPQARAMLPLALHAWQEGKTVTAAEALPVYLRNKVV